jgi:hypothetical protein
MLVQDTLKLGLENDWLVADGGSYPQSAIESGDRFAGAVASWFAGAQAGPFPCATAAARRAQLAASAAAALQAGAAPAAGSQLALAIAQYIVGQLFGAGVAGFPIATSAAGAMLGAVFSDTGTGRSERAQAIAGACTLLAVSTIVTFPAPLPPAPLV